MSSILTTPPAAEPVSLAEAKAHLRIGNGDEDEMIGRLIVAARRHVEVQAGLALISQVWSQFRDDWPDTGVAELPLAPLLSVDEVKTYGEDDVAASIDPAHYYADRISHPPRLLLRGSRVWARPGRIGNGIEIVFAAGFGPVAADVPAELRQAILDLVAHWYAQRGDDRETGLPLTVMTVIERFREKRL